MGDDNRSHSLIEQLGKAFVELESQNNVSEEKVLWKELEEHFRHLETVMQNKSSQIQSMEKAFREEESYFNSLLAERETVVADKEQDMLDQIQELKDSAVAAIIEARSHHLEPMYVKVSSSICDTNSDLIIPKKESSPLKTGENVDLVAVEPTKPCHELTQICKQMDAKALLNFMSENSNNKPITLEELSLALESAAEPGRLVLDSLEGFYPLDDQKDEIALQGMRGSCLLILEAMGTLLARANELSGDLMQRAKAVAELWKPKLANVGAAPNGNYSLEVHAFLQLISTFRITSEFDEEELCKLVLAASQYRQVPALCRSLGITHKIPDIVGALNSSGKQIYAVHFVHEFKLTETYPLSSLLRAYLKDLRRNSQGKGNKSGSASGGQNNANAQELAAVKAVIQCIQEYKLEGEYPLDPLQRRAVQLDRSVNSDRKRFVETVKPPPQQLKKPRARGGFSGNRAAPTALAYGARAYPVTGAYSYQAAPAPIQQGYDARSYYYPPQDDRAHVTAYNATPGSYGGYNSHQPYI